ncbi:MAG: 50S ribosomal protein L6 [Chloroflexota bacterium]
MSRIGKLPIAIPPGVTVDIKENEVTVVGPKGKLGRRFNPDINIALKDNSVVVTRPDDAREHRALHGLTRSLLANMLTGVSSGFEKGLEMVGVGYRVEKDGANIVLRCGFSHQVKVNPLSGVALSVEGNNKIKVTGIDKEVVGEMAAEIRAIRPPDAYKGKGIRYAGEQIKLKPGKAAKAVGSK